ncbi:hypothetical protein Sjap_007643 [Stephania japonica]|uniref:Uncharacterized protein n=1 Tax=Stephania japonica TaxID=461633 RepID=A0AAP0PBI4_9MAGN
MYFEFYRSIIGYALLMIPSLIYSVYFGGFLVQFLIEKMGMMGSLPREARGFRIPNSPRREVEARHV